MYQGAFKGPPVCILRLSLVSFIPPSISFFVFHPTFLSHPSIYRPFTFSRPHTFPLVPPFASAAEVSVILNLIYQAPSKGCLCVCSFIYPIDQLILPMRLRLRIYIHCISRRPLGSGLCILELSPYLSSPLLSNSSFLIPSIIFHPTLDLIHHFASPLLSHSLSFWPMSLIAHTPFTVYQGALLGLASVYTQFSPHIFHPSYYPIHHLSPPLLSHPLSFWPMCLIALVHPFTEIGRAHV